jgi:hypothetical protein
MESPPRTPPKKRSFSPFDFTVNTNNEYTRVVANDESTTQTQSLDMESPHPLERGDPIDKSEETPVVNDSQEVSVNNSAKAVGSFQEVPAGKNIKAVGSFVLEYKLGGGTVVDDCRRSTRSQSEEPSSK